MKKIFICIFVLFMSVTVQAELKIDVSGAQTEPTPIALPTFTGNTSKAADIGQKITEVITADLENSGLFRIIDEEAYIQTMENAGTMPKFADWQASNF